MCDGLSLIRFFFLPIMRFGNASKFCKRVYITILIEQEMTILILREDSVSVATAF